MKSFRLLSLPLLAAALTASVSAQTAPAAPAVKAIAPARVAYVNSNAFLEPATGVKQLVKVYQTLELEFSPQQSELALLQEKLRTIVGELNKLGASPGNDAAIAAKQAEGQKLQQELQAKQQAAQEAFQKRQQELQGPVSTELGKELRIFAQARDISMLFDLAKLGDALLDAKAELDVTADFIAHYNAKHP